MVELKSVSSTIFNGAPLYSITPSSDKTIQGVPLINIRDIEDDQINWQNLSIISTDIIRKPERFYVKSGDVLITSRGTQFKVAIVPEKISSGIITANLIAIRPDPTQLSPIYLAAYLRSKNGERELLARRTSQTVQIVLSLVNVEELRIPMPSLNVQEKIVEAIKALDEEYRINQIAIGLNRKIRNQIVIDMLEQK